MFYYTGIINSEELVWLLRAMHVDQGISAVERMPLSRHVIFNTKFLTKEFFESVPVAKSLLADLVSYYAAYDNLDAEYPEDFKELSDDEKIDYLLTTTKYFSVHIPPKRAEQLEAAFTGKSELFVVQAAFIKEVDVRLLRRIEAKLGYIADNRFNKPYAPEHLIDHAEFIVENCPHHRFAFVDMEGQILFYDSYLLFEPQGHVFIIGEDCKTDDFECCPCVSREKEV